MNRKFKTLGLVLAAVFAMSAIGASAASAATTFHANKSPIGVTGTQTTGHVFTTSAGTVTCSTATFTGTTAAATSATQTLTPTYSGCKAFGFINVPIDVNGCGYNFNANGTTQLECPAGASIAITTPGCTTTVGEQHFASGMTYATNGSTPSRDITATTNISGIKYNECGTARENGTYKGTTTVDATEAANEVWVS